jgi:VWFA-related protein
MKRLLAVSVFLLLAILLPSGSGQQTDPSQGKGQGPLQHEVSVVRKLVQVYVTDKKGIPITDLQKDDFVIYDNKDEKQITEFERHSLSLPGTPVRAPDAEPVVTAIEPTPPLLSRKFFLLFDLVFTQDKGFRIARKAALKFLESGLMPTDEASVLLFAGGRSLEVRKLPTRDHNAVRDAVESLTIADLLNRHFNESETVGPQILSGQDTPFSAMSRPSSSGGPSEIRIFAGNFIWALKSFAQALRTQPGQKHVILYSKGIASATIGRGQGGGTYSELSRGYAAMCKELAAAGVSVFPVNTADPDAFKMTFGTGETTLRETAASTGGRYLGFAVNAEKLMETVNDITGMYYVLGYPISQTWDGKFHTVRVKVTRPDCEVHAQPGYFNPKPFTEYSKIEKEIHLVDLALSDKPMSQDPARFAMQAIPIAFPPKDNLLFIAEIPQGQGGIEGPRIEVSSLVFNALDEIVDSQRVQMDLPAGRSGQGSRFLLTSLSARQGTYKCRIVLRNLDTGQAAVAGATAIVPEGVADKLLLFPPLLATEGGANMLVSGNTGNGGQAIDPQAAQAFLLDPKEYEPYLGIELEAGSSIGAAIRCSSPNDDISELELSARLDEQTPEKSQDIGLHILGKKSEKSTKMFLTKIDIPPTPPGRYNLVISINDTRSGQSSKVTRSFRVK